MNKPLSLWHAMLALVCTLVFFPLCAQTPGVYLEDNANVISKEMEDKLIALLKETQSEHQFHIEAVILPHYYEKSADNVINAYYQNMIKNTKNVDRMALLIIALEKNNIHLITTPNINGIFTQQVIEDITANIQKQLAVKNYDEMVRVGIAGILHYYTENFSAIEGRHSFRTITNIFILIIMLIVVVYLIKRKATPPT